MRFWRDGGRIDFDQCRARGTGSFFFHTQEDVMGFKDILVHLDTTPRNAIRLDIAAGLPARNSGRRIGLNVTDMRTPALSTATPPMA